MFLPGLSAYLKVETGGFEVGLGFRTWEPDGRCVGLACQMSLCAAQPFGRLFLGESTSEEAAPECVTTCNRGWWHHPRRGCFLRHLSLWWAKYLQWKSRISASYENYRVANCTWTAWVQRERQTERLKLSKSTGQFAAFPVPIAPVHMLFHIY